MLPDCSFETFSASKRAEVFRQTHWRTPHKQEESQLDQKFSLSLSLSLALSFFVSLSLSLSLSHFSLSLDLSLFFFPLSLSLYIYIYISLSLSLALALSLSLSLSFSSFVSTQQAFEHLQLIRLAAACLGARLKPEQTLACISCLEWASGLGCLHSFCE